MVSQSHLLAMIPRIESSEFHHERLAKLAKLHAQSIYHSAMALGHDIHSFQTCEACLTLSDQFVQQVKAHLSNLNGGNDA